MTSHTMIIPRANWPTLCGLMLIFLPLVAMAESISMPPPDSDLVGKIRYVKAVEGDTLIDIAHRNSVGQDEIVMANPTESRYYWVPGEGTKVKIPGQFILPDAPRVGIVVNIPEMRIYYYPHGPNKEAPTEVITYPISIGRMDWKSPLGVTKIVEKIKDPTWTPPESIKKEHALDGEILPDVVPAGPDNPLGQFAMRLGVKGSYLIHGTGQNKADGIGMMVTHGCMRMYPEDVAQLFPKVSLGTQVNLVNQPVKLGWLGETLFIEVSQPLDEDNLSYNQLLSLATGLIQKKTADKPGFILNGEALKQALAKPNGIPTAISGHAPVTTQAATTGQQNPMPAPVPSPGNLLPSASGGELQNPTVQTKPETPPGQLPRQPSQEATQAPHPAEPTANLSPRPIATAPIDLTNPIAPPSQSQPIPVIAKPSTQPAPLAPPSNSKTEQQLLPPIY